MQDIGEDESLRSPVGVEPRARTNQVTPFATQASPQGAAVLAQAGSLSPGGSGPRVYNTSAQSERAQRHWKLLRAVTKTVMTLSSISQDIRTFGAARRDSVLEQAAVVDPSVSKKDHWLVFMPENVYRSAWDQVVVALLLYVAFVVPLSVAFVNENSTVRDIEIVVDVLFGCDIVINFLTAYDDASSGKRVTNQRQVAMRYLRGWFMIDFVATFPIYVFLDGEDDDSAKLTRLARLPRLAKFLRILRLLKLFRMARLARVMRQAEMHWHVSAPVKRLSQFFFWTIVATHLSSCIWYFMAVVDDMGVSTWVFRRVCQQLTLDCDIPGMAESCTAAQQSELADECLLIAEANQASLYLDALYWSFSTISTVGYGDVSSSTESEKLVSIACVMLGVSCYSYTISNMSSMMASLDMEDNNFRRKMTSLNEFLRKTDLNRDLQNRLRHYFEYSQKNGDVSLTQYQQDVLLKELSPALRSEVIHELHHTLIAEIPFLQGKDAFFVSHAVLQLQPMEVRAGQVFMREGEHAGEIFFIATGRAELIKHGQVIKVLPAGSFLGEAMLVQSVHCVSARAITDCRMHIWTRNAVRKTLQDFPVIADELEAIATQRIKHFEEAKGSRKSNVAAPRPSKLAKQGSVQNLGLGIGLKSQLKPGTPTAISAVAAFAAAGASSPHPQREEPNSANRLDALDEKVVMMQVQVSALDDKMDEVLALLRSAQG